MKEDPIKNFRKAFNQFLKEENLEHTFKQKQLLVNWEKIMGKTIASRTSQLFFKEKILFIKLSSAPLKQEMMHSKDKFLQLVSDEIGIGEVEDVRFL
jgi:hypothetical protein